VTRLRPWFRAWLIALDQLAYVTLDLPAALMGHPTPSPCETISSKCGRMAAQAHRWARIAAAVIDWSAERLGSPPGHCARAIVRADMLTFY
jgi:hypothetical protein